MIPKSDIENATVQAAISRLIGDRLYAITFILDYIQLHFDYHLINAYAPLAVTTPEFEFGNRTTEFRNEACRQIGECVSDARLTAEQLLVVFPAAEVRLSLRDDDYSGPEAGELWGPIGHLIFRQSDISVIRGVAMPDSPRDRRPR